VRAIETVMPAVPRLRGRLHQVAFFVSIPAGVALVALARGAVARTAAIIYAASLTGMFAASAAFHRIPWRETARKWMGRLDHAMIYLLIAGTYTPFSLLVLKGSWAIVILAVVWTGALVGVALKLSTPRLSGLASALYIILGWTALAALPVLVTKLSPIGLVLLFAGGVLYTGGALILRRNRPDPNPEVFGYHEVWHAMVAAAAACHYGLVFSLVRG